MNHGNQRLQLEAYVRALGAPSLFITASAADLHWPSLLRNSDDYDAWNIADPTQRTKIARKFLRENPHLATEHFQQRPPKRTESERLRALLGTTPDGDKPRSDAGSRAYGKWRYPIHASRYGTILSFSRISLIGYKSTSAAIPVVYAAGSRVVLTLDCRAEEDRDAVIDVPDIDGDRKSTRPRRSLYVQYLERDEEYEATTLFTFLTRDNTNRPQPPRLADRVPDRILRYAPRYRSDPEHHTYSYYCRPKVVLHVPWRIYPSLPLKIDSTEYVTWEDVFHYLRDRDPRRLQFDYIYKIPTVEEGVD
ncbi:hypothetical protein E4U33_007295, partial [Claviceps sp. LM78 group G4]